MMRWVAAFGLLAGFAGVARAQVTASCDVPIIHAMHNGDDGHAPTIDERIQRLKPYLQKAPFTAWRDFKLLDRKELRVAEKGSSAFTLPNGREATLTFIDHTEPPGDHRMRLQLKIEDKTKGTKMLDTTFVLDEGGVVLLVGQKYESGILVLGVSCKTHE
jgi:hypothetical protein